jgi:hypothetical protein
VILDTMLDPDLVRRHLQVLRQTAQRLGMDAGHSLLAMASSGDEQWVLDPRRCEVRAARL